MAHALRKESWPHPLTREHTCAYDVGVKWTGAEIKQRRLQLGLTQTELANAIGATRNAVGNWEAGRATPHGVWLSGLEETLGDHIFTDRSVVALRDATFEQTLRHLWNLYRRARDTDGDLPFDLQADGEVGEPPTPGTPNVYTQQDQRGDNGTAEQGER
jgi:transcriptional regulator with XRE-family HTH domain